MNNSYNYSFLTNNKSQEITQHIAFEKHPSEKEQQQNVSKNLTQNPVKKPTMKQALLSDTL